MSWKSLEDKVERGPISAGISFIFIGATIVMVGMVVFGGLGLLSNPIKQGSRLINKTIDADNVLYNYEWFKQRYEDVQAIDIKIQDAAISMEGYKDDLGNRSGWDREDKIEYSRLSSIKLGLEQQRADLVAEYNARSQMVNRSIFKSGVPERIN